jgi:hypothetical protein
MTNFFSGRVSHCIVDRALPWNYRGLVLLLSTAKRTAEKRKTRIERGFLGVSDEDGPAMWLLRAATSAVSLSRTDRRICCCTMFILLVLVFGLFRGLVIASDRD